MGGHPTHPLTKSHRPSCSHVQFIFGEKCAHFCAPYVNAFYVFLSSNLSLIGNLMTKFCLFFFINGMPYYGERDLLLKSVVVYWWGVLFIHDLETDDGLCCRLTRACPKEPEPIPFKDLEVKKSEIQLSKKLGQGQFGEVWAGENRTIHFMCICICIVKLVHKVHKRKMQKMK